MSDDFGPRFKKGVPDWHRGVDYLLAPGTDALALSSGVIQGLTWNGGLIVLRIESAEAGHMFRYLHMFRDQAALPISVGNFSLVRTDFNKAGLGSELAIIKWNVSSLGACADYVLITTAAARNGDSVSDANGNPIPASDCNGIAPLQSSVAFHQAIGPVGTSGDVGAHLHVDLFDSANPQLSQNPLLHIVHPASSFALQFLKPDDSIRTAGAIVDPANSYTTALKIRVDSGANKPHSGKDMEKLSVFVDTTAASAEIYSWSFGGATPAHDPVHSDIAGSTDVFSDGVRNGIRPVTTNDRDPGGIEDYVYNDWETAASSVLSTSV